MFKNIIKKSTNNANKIDRRNQLRNSGSNPKQTIHQKPKVPPNHSGDYYSDKGNKMEQYCTNKFLVNKATEIDKEVTKIYKA